MPTSSAELRPQVRAAKLVPPLEAIHHVARSALVDRMTRSPRARLTLIHAPAGFGKTTLLSQCHTAVRRLRCDALWLTMDAADNDVDRLATHLEAALARIGGRRSTVASAVQGLAGELLTAPRARPLVLFLDEFELLNSVTALQFMQHLVAGMSADCHVVIGSRSLPDMEFGRMRVRGELMEIGLEELRFNEDETRVLLRDKHALEMRDADLCTLRQRTEGWPAALHLAALSLAGHRDHAAFIASFTGSNSVLAEYLAEDILARLEAPVQAFLLESSVLPQFNASLCDAVREQTNSRDVLDHLERAGLFILSLDAERQWYRFHSLFAGFLRYRLERAQPGRLAELNRRAAAWYMKQGRSVPAIDYLISGRAFSDASALIATEADGLLAQGRVRLLARWLSRIPDEALTRFPRLRVVEAWTLVLNRRYPEAMRSVSIILAQDATEAAREEAQTIRCLALSMSDRLDESLATAAEHILQLPADEAFQYGVLTNILAAGLIARNRYDEGRQQLAQALRRHSFSQPNFSRAVGDYLEAAIDLVQGRLGDAQSRLRPMTQGPLGGERGRLRQAGHGRALVSVLLAVALYDTGSIKEAQRLLSESLPYMKENGGPDAVVLSHTLSARIALLNGDRDIAVRHLAGLELIGRDVGIPRMIAAAWLERSRMHWNAAEHRLAQQALDRAVVTFAAVPGDNSSVIMTDVDLPQLMVARLSIGRGGAAATSAGLLLEPMLKDAVAARRGRRALRIRILMALALNAEGKSKPAQRVLGEILRDCAGEAPIMAFVDEGAPMAALFAEWQASAGAGSDGVLPRFATQLRDAFEQMDSTAVRPLQVEALTRRELGVLQLLAEGLRNAEIATRLFVSETTIKAHLRNINTKLGASSRTNAVAIARQRRLLD